MLQSLKKLDAQCVREAMCRKLQEVPNWKRHNQVRKVRPCFVCLVLPSLIIFRPGQRIKRSLKVCKQIPAYVTHKYLFISINL